MVKMGEKYGGVPSYERVYDQAHAIKSNTTVEWPNHVTHTFISHFLLAVDSGRCSLGAVSGCHGVKARWVQPGTASPASREISGRPALVGRAGADITRRG
jgi:hypothetical protein